jgi:hypothetical protein
VIVQSIRNFASHFRKEIVMGAFNVVTGSWAAAATGDQGIAHGLAGVSTNPQSDAFVALLQQTSQAVTSTTPVNATNFFVSRTETTSGSVYALVGVGVRSGQY